MYKFQVGDRVEFSSNKSFDKNGDDEHYDVGMIVGIHGHSGRCDYEVKWDSSSETSIPIVDCIRLLEQPKLIHALVKPGNSYGMFFEENALREEVEKHPQFYNNYSIQTLQVVSSTPVSKFLKDSVRLKALAKLTDEEKVALGLV